MISVIVPVYNCEKYLNNSIQSLIDQTIFEDLEIIFVDDGSTDESARVIQGYEGQYSNIKLIRQSNKGVSVARNRGLEEAKGEYIAFFDADDIAQKTLYEKLLELLVENNADLSCVNYSMHFPDGVIQIHKRQQKKVLYNEEIVKSFFSERLLCNNTIDKLFKSSIVKDIVFPEEYAIGEDMFFIFQYILKAQKAIIDTTDSLYLYCIHADSAMKSKFSVKYFDAVLLAKKMMNELTVNGSLYLYAEANWIHEICKTMCIYYQSGTSEYSDVIDEYKQTIKGYSLKKAYLYLSKKHFFSLILMRYSSKLYIWLYRVLHIG